MLPFENMLKKKGSDIAIFMGTGPSINLITKENISLINEWDKWSVNNFIFHNFIIPNFYHPEIKAHRDGSIMHLLCKDKYDQYKDVNWVIDDTRRNLLEYVGLYPNIYSYQKDISDKLNQSGLHYPEGNRLKLRCYASMSLVLEMMVRMGYKK